MPQKKIRIPKDGMLVKDVETGMPLRARRVTLKEFRSLSSIHGISEVSDADTIMRFVQNNKKLSSGYTLDLRRDCPYYVMHQDRTGGHWSVNRPEELACFVEEIAARLKARAKTSGAPPRTIVTRLSKVTLYVYIYIYFNYNTPLY